ncbi:hypothetical protein FB451DRAFT_1100213 [Mycena latifolia]|nr:hypothetical protein FB451DRAFT_1100213 [Mycena latifolia]
MFPRLDFAPFRTHYFLLVTTVLAIIAWFLTFVSQAIATAQFGHRAVGVQWFAIFLQGFLTLGVVCSIATDSIQTGRLQLAVFGAVATVFAVLGVEQGVYAVDRPALSSMGAGYLVLAVVDILWMLYFTSEEDSLALHIFNRLGTGGLAPPARRRRTRGQSVAASALSYSTSKPNYALGGGVSSEDVNREAKRASAAPSGVGGGLKRSGTGGRSIRTITSRKSLVSAAAHGGDVERRASAVSNKAPPMPEPPTASPALPMSPAPEGAVSPAVEGPAPEVPDATLSAAVEQPPPDDDGEYPLRAKALHAYHGSPEDPNELTFAKGEILEIEDQEGKWWHAKKADGTLGIVPSNYLVVI